MPSDSMNIGVSGLDAYQAQIDVISNNIANVGTTSYKGQSLSFQDLLYQTQQPGSGPTKTSGGVNYQQVGIGVKIGGTDTNNTQGGVQTTGVTTNMMVTGDGYFILKNADGTGTPQYTRDGDFSLDSNGTLFDPTSGRAVMGYSANAAGAVQTGALGPIAVPIGLKGMATATGAGLKSGPTGDQMYDMTYAGNLDTTSYAAAVAAAATATGAPALAAGVAATAAAASTTATSLATTDNTTVSGDDTTAGTALTNSLNAALLAASVPTAANITLATLAAGTCATTLANESSAIVTASVNANAAAALTGATAASVVSATGASSFAHVVAVNYAASVGATAATVAAAVANFYTQFTTDTAAAGVASSKAVASLTASIAAASAATTAAADTTTASIAAAFTASATANAVTSGTTIYDSLGAPHLMNISFTPANLGAAMPLLVNNASGVPTEAATAWSYTMTSTDGTLFANGTTTSAPQYAFYDQGGQFINTSGTMTPSNTSVHSAGLQPSAATGNQLTITQWGSPADSNNSSVVVAPPPAGPIGIDIGSYMTANASASGITLKNQNGYAPGTLDSMTVGTDGTITGTYTNGQSTTLGRVVLAAFQNESGLLRVGSNDYLESVDSGQAQVGTADAGRLGSITGNALELSNVSIGDEFTKLITAQNAYTANSKSVTTANEDDQTVLGLIH